MKYNNIDYIITPHTMKFDGLANCLHLTIFIFIRSSDNNNDMSLPSVELDICIEDALSLGSLDVFKEH